MRRSERLFRAVTDRVVERPRRVVVVCLLLTVAFAPGMALLETETGPDQFVDDIPEADAWDAVTEEFEPAFGDDERTTQLIQRDRNVLDRSGLLVMLRTQERLEARDSLRVVDSRSPASQVAREIDPDAETAAEQREAVERASPREVRDAVAAAADDPAFESLLSEDFNAETGTASASLAVVTHEFPAGADVTAVQREAETVVDRTPGDVIVFGSGILDDEFASVIFDSLFIVVPAALATILGLLAYAYRDPFDFALGGVALLMTVVWTFGFTGYAGIPFSDMLVAVPVLLLAIGIDFGIHTVNRYREERVAGDDPTAAMQTALGQLVVAYTVIAGTTVIGFLANLTSELGPIREFGVVAGIGITFTLVIFAGFLPAAKLELDRWRAGTRIPTFGTTPLGAERSVLGRLLPSMAAVSRPAPAVFVVVVLLVAGGAGVYGAGVDTTFDDEDFLPPAEEPAYVQYLPGPMQPGEYTVTSTLDVLEEKFETAEDDTVTIYVETRMREDHVLREHERVEADPPDSFVVEDGSARSSSVRDPIEQLAENDPEFAALVADSSLDGGQPNRNLHRIYAELRASDYEAFTDEYLAGDDRATRVVFEVRTDATDEEITADARAMADRYRGDAVATGQIVVFQAVADTIFESAIRSLAAALGLSAVFLVVLYGLFLGRPVLGAVTLVPVVVSVTMLTATMRALGIPFNALTATILAITIGLGVDYTVHVSHRFYDEYEATGDVHGAIRTTLQGTGGALTGTMLTTAAGTGVLVLAVTPLLGQFGLLTAASIFLAYVAAIVVLPPALVVWAAVADRRWELLAVGRLLTDGSGSEAGEPAGDRSAETDGGVELAVGVDADGGVEADGGDATDDGGTLEEFEWGPREYPDD